MITITSKNNYLFLLFKVASRIKTSLFKNIFRNFNLLPLIMQFIQIQILRFYLTIKRVTTKHINSTQSNSACTCTTNNPPHTWKIAPILKLIKHLAFTHVTIHKSIASTNSDYLFSVIKLYQRKTLSRLFHFRKSFRHLVFKQLVHSFHYTIFRI